MNAPTDLPALKARQQTVGGSGDDAVIGATLQLVGEQLAEACDSCWYEGALDVAARTGNAALATARPGALAVPSDYLESAVTRP